MTPTAGRAVCSNARAISELIRVPPGIAAPAGCANRDEANSRLRFCGMRRRAMLAVVRKFQRLDCVMSSHATPHRCNARLLEQSNIEQQLRACMFRFRVFRPAPCPRSRRIAARMQRRFVSSCRLPSPGRVAHAAVAHSGGCELRRSLRFSWAKVWRSIDENVANVCRECTRADSHRAASSRRLIALIKDVEQRLHARALSSSAFSAVLHQRSSRMTCLFPRMSHDCDLVTASLLRLMTGTDFDSADLDAYNLKLKLTMGQDVKWVGP